MIILNPGERINPGQVEKSLTLLLTYQTDGNLVVYRGSTPLWATMTFESPGYCEMQGDGNFVMYNDHNVPIWATGTSQAGACLELSEEGLEIVHRSPTVLWTTGQFPDPPEPPDPPDPPEPGDVKHLVGEVVPMGRSFRDQTGARYVHGCTDFGGIVKFHEDRDKALRSLDTTASHQQFIRAAYRLNGWLWTPSGLTIDPVRDGWWEEALRGYLLACHQRELRVNLTCADMYNCTMDQARSFVARAAQIAASVDPNCVILHEWNEMRGTVPGGESTASVDALKELTGIWRQHNPRNLRGLSDPADQAKSGMMNLSQNPANVALLHNVRWTPNDAIRRAFNGMYENYPGKSYSEGEPTGPENPIPPGEFNRKVYQPVEDHNSLLAIYTMHIMVGAMSTYFNDPALVCRYPLDSTWGFKEIPAFWRMMEIPEDIGQGTLIPGHKGDAPVRLKPGPPQARADSVVIGDQSFTIVHGGAITVANKLGMLTAYTADDGVIHEGVINPGESIPVDASTPTILRIR